MTIETHIRDPKNTAGIAGHPIHPTLIPFPTAFLAVILARDAAFLVPGDIRRFTATTQLHAGTGRVTIGAAGTSCAASRQYCRPA